MQHRSAEDLHVVVPHPLGAAAGFAARGECFRQQLVERRAFRQPRLQELQRERLQFVVGERLRLRFEFVHFRERRAGDERCAPPLFLRAKVAQPLAPPLVGGTAHHARDDADAPFDEGVEPVGDALEDGRFHAGLCRCHSRNSLAARARTGRADSASVTI